MNDGSVALRQGDAPTLCDAERRADRLIAGESSCLKALEIELSEPLGSRAVIDAGTGEQVEVVPSPYGD